MLLIFKAESNWTFWNDRCCCKPEIRCILFITQNKYANYSKAAGLSVALNFVQLNISAKCLIQVFIPQRCHTLVTHLWFSNNAQLTQLSWGDNPSDLYLEWPLLNLKSMTSIVSDLERIRMRGWWQKCESEPGSRLGGQTQCSRCWLVQSKHVTWILATDWSRLITWPGYWPLVGPEWSRDQDTGLWLVTQCSPVAWLNW